MGFWVLGFRGLGFRGIVNPRKLEHGFRMIVAGIPFSLGHEDNDVPTFSLLLCRGINNCQYSYGGFLIVAMVKVYYFPNPNSN